MPLSIRCPYYPLLLIIPRFVLCSNACKGKLRLGKWGSGGVPRGREKARQALGSFPPGPRPGGLLPARPGAPLRPARALCPAGGARDRGRGGREARSAREGPRPGRPAAQPPPRFRGASLPRICCIVCINMNILFCLFCLLGANKAVSFFFTPNAALRAINQWVVFG